MANAPAPAEIPRSSPAPVGADGEAGADGESAGGVFQGNGCASDRLPPGGLDREDAIRVAELFKVLGDPTRVLILQALIQTGELCVHHLAEAVDMSQSAVSHHLRILRTARLIRFRREGREVYYRPDDEHVEQLIGVCVDHIRHDLAAGSRGSESREGAEGVALTRETPALGQTAPAHES